jgi:malto-oligosyltrehalose synthase/malto-oligosyltrehalose trehalohydrolase
LRAPTSTYRLQITEGFDLLEAAKTLRYLHDLGVDWVYLSPVLAAETGSNHGYDVSSHATVDPSRGRGAGLAALSAEARRLGMGVLVDIVPNHVGIGRPWENEWWWHVLTHGRTSPFASAFDIDWEFGGGKIRVPVVVDGDIDRHGDIAELRVLGGELHYRENRFPLAPGTADNSLTEDPNAVLRRQHYALVNWRDADRDLNYRRFFAVNTLVAVRVEDPQWFDASHAEIVRWFDEGLVDGLRIDHPDGLRDPALYLSRLAEVTKDAYVVVEKILAPGESLPHRWVTAGTTGYDALALVDRLFVDPAGEQPLTDLEAELRGHATDWRQLTHDTRRAVADGILYSETARIAREAAREITSDIEHEQLVDAVAELLSCFPVYRSYLPDGRDHLEAAVEEALARRPELTTAIRELEIVLTDGATDASQRFQQTSGMVMAKGVEDCAFYRWGRLTSLNEVGADPAMFTYTPAHVYSDLAVRQALWPHALSTRTTHDTKRGEDVRARITVLSEVPELWGSAVRRLQELAPLPDPGFANILWQAAVGAWPISPERLHVFAEKAMREAGEHTTWTEVDEEYEAGVHAVVDQLYNDERVRAVFDEVLDAVVDPGWSNSLSAAAVNLTMPGVPDVYQGSELWQLSLVDPDNRRPVDFPALAAMLDDVESARLVGGVDDPGTAKQALVHAALQLRRDQPELFRSFTPVTAEGAAAEHVVAFDTGGVVTLATRLPVGLARKGGWGDTTVDLPLGSYRDAVSGTVIHATGTRMRADDLFAEGPVALLVALPVRGGQRTRFDVWAPGHDSVTLVVRPVGDPVAEREISLRPAPDGWWTPPTLMSGREYDYGYRIDDSDDVLPDPRSRRQPEGVHGMSRTVDPKAYHWRDRAWTGRQVAGSILYELHVGTFTEEGTLDAAIAHLDHLVDLGVGFVELMPVNAFNGEWNWGYDGVLWYAVHELYGGPEAYRRFVDACHARGLGVIQDVVYNHLGPSGNYLSRFAPYLSKGGLWGASVDVETYEQVRRYVIENAIMWFVEFHVDALRLDAIHALVDSSEIHVLEELATEVAALSAHLGRPLTLIAESDLNDTELVLPREAGGAGLDAQWNDDFHHAVHTALTGDDSGYYVDFGPLRSLAKVFEKGFFYDGTWSTFRGRDHGRPVATDRFPAWRLLAYTQNHDQVGNRARGDRLTEWLDDDQLLLGAMLMLGSPFTPMLFMGEEWAASTPFPYFSSHPEPELAQAVTHGRIKEFDRLGWDPAAVLDPQDPETYRSAILRWDEVSTGRHAVVLEGYRQLTRLRHRLAALTNPDLRDVRCRVGDDARWIVVERGDVVLVANLGDAPATVTLSIDTYQVVWQTPTPVDLDGDRLDLPRHAGAVLVRR